MSTETTKEQSLERLIERVKAATGSDRELDFHIHIALVEDAAWPVRDRLGRITNPDYRMSDYLYDYAGVINSDDQDFDFPRYTASIDAALALVERVRPGNWRLMLMKALHEVNKAPDILDMSQMPRFIVLHLFQAIKETSNDHE